LLRQFLKRDLSSGELTPLPVSAVLCAADVHICPVVHSVRGRCGLYNVKTSFTVVS
jgi:hypothetical protein